MADDLRLPIFRVEHELIDALKRDKRFVIQAPTGSGKSTQVPQMLLDSGVCKGQIVILQPRRLAARMLASRVARERRSRLGDEVGYQIRFDDCSSRNTRIKYVTEGILLRQMLTDPGIKHIGTIIFDEFHERHLYGDVTLGRAMQIQQAQRPDLRIIVMSATLDSESLQNYLSPCKMIRTEGRTFPVTAEYLEKPADQRRFQVWELATREIERVLPSHPNGDVLIFMPGAYEITKTIQALNSSRSTKGFEILPLHGELPPAQQDAAVDRYDRRKVVVSTNVAETSLTIDGITLVVDSGLARIAKFDQHRGINTLYIEKISRASADQRMGRAGRTAAGHCLRLWTEADHASRLEREIPEIRRVDLSEIALTLKAGGVTNLAEFPWIETPEPRSLERAETLLHDLGAIDKATGHITPVGIKLVAFPVHPRYARMLLASHEYGCVPSVALIAALTQERSVILTRQGEHIREQRERKIEGSPESDFIALMQAWEYARRNDFDLQACKQVGIHAGVARQVGRLRDFFLHVADAERLGVETDNRDVDALAKCILAGFSDQLACRSSMGTLHCELVHKRKGELSRDSEVRASRLFVACDVSEIEGRGRELKVKLSLATAVKPEWLQELFPDQMSNTREVYFDSATKRVVVEERQLFNDLVLERKQKGNPSENEAAAILAEEVVAGRMSLGEWDHSVEQWILRVNCLSGWCPELGMPKFTENEKKGVIQQVCLGAFSYKEIKAKPVWPVIRGWLSSQQQQMLDAHAPERITLSNGRTAKVTYSAELPPSISVPIQSLYGVTKTPRIANGAIALVVHILAPNQRDVQITQDLGRFWREHYPGIKKELQRKYPKHEWR